MSGYDQLLQGQEQYPPSNYPAPQQDSANMGKPVSSYQYAGTPPQQVAAGGETDFQHGVCSSCTSCSVFWCGYCCAPCYHIYLMDTNLQEYSPIEGLLFLGIQMITSIPLFPFHQAASREKLRKQLGIRPQSFMHDCCLTCWCAACATCQEGAEIEHRQKLNQLPKKV